MTRFKVGDRGQRYQVQCKDELENTKILGWAETDDGVAQYVKAIKLHPVFHSPKVIDRQAHKDGKPK